jgi:glycosyltransferase involved in cell wall biosynthesis
MQADLWHNILWSSYKGAVYSEIHRLAQERGINVRFFQIAETDKARKALTNLNLSYHNYPYELVFRGSHDAIPLRLLYWKLAKYVVTSRADVIALAGYHKPEYWLQLVVGRLVGKKMGVFCDATAYENRPTLVKSILKRFFFRSCHVCFCYGERSASYVESFGVARERIVAGCQAAALPHDYTASDALRKRIAYTAQATSLRYLYVGRLSPEKNLEVLLEAFAKVLAGGRAATLIIVGAGPQRAELEALARSLSIDAQVEFLGSKNGNELYDEYLRATCLMLPSRREPWGLVVNEALAHGCPVIVSDHCGCIPELVVDRTTGFVVNCGNVDELADKMEAAAVDFRDVETTAKACLAQIAPFTPTAAAGRVLAGLLK